MKMYTDRTETDNFYLSLCAILIIIVLNKDLH
jgi:hypothetical protein